MSNIRDLGERELGGQTIGGNPGGLLQSKNRVVKVDSHLGDENWVGKLTLVYHTKNEAVSKVIPFFENPVIIESQNPRYMNYAVVGRSSNLFGYLGADSRKFNLSFKLSLPHITTMLKQYSNLWATPPTKLQKRKEILEEGISDMAGEEMSLRKRETQRGYEQSVGGMFNPVTAAKEYVADQNARADAKTKRENIAKERMLSTAQLDDINEKQKHFQGVAKEFDEEFETLIAGTPGGNLKKFLSYNSPLYNPDSEGSKLRRSTLNHIASIIASIRSTVVNNSVNPEYGPPLVRLDWGILFRDVPCVCKGYSMTINDRGGYDKNTLLPRIIDVTMNLEESRTLETSEIIGDSLIGWEVLIGTEQNPGMTTDPGNFQQWKTINTKIQKGIKI